MDKNVLDYVVEKTNDLMGAPSCSGEAKAAAQAWLDAVGTDREAEETRKYVEELEADIMPIDGLIGFAESEHGAQAVSYTHLDVYKRQADAARLEHAVSNESFQALKKAGLPAGS